MSRTAQLLPRTGAALAASALLLAATALPVTARPDVGGGVERAVTVARADAEQFDGGCPLRRLDRQLVRCDDLTGAGVRAPRWVLLLEPTWSSLLR